MKEKNIYDLAKETIRRYNHGKKMKVKIIGAREREKTVEKLFTDEEKQTTIEKDDFYIILPDKDLFRKRKGRYTKKYLRV